MDVLSLPTSETIKKKISFEDYLLMPEINHPYEIIDGKFMLSPVPLPVHQRIAANVFTPLSNYVETEDFGIVLFAPLRTRQPDVLFIHKDKLSGTGLDAIEELQILEIAPDLIIEVLSSSDTEKVLSGKLSDYQRIGVKECWLISREARSVEILQFTKEQSQSLGHFGLGETIGSQVFPDFRLTVDSIFT